MIRKMKSKKLKRWGTICVAALTAGALLCSCGSQQFVAKNKIHVGVTYYNQSATFLNELLACFVEDLKDSGKHAVETTVTIRDAAGSQRTRND